MKPSFLFLCLYISTLLSNAQTYQLTVQNGYGSGPYAIGDTIHIWSEDWPFTKTFSHWSGQTSFLQMPDEWLTRLVMPGQDVTVTSNLRDLLPGADFTEEQLMGRDTLQQVFHYFPPGGAPKGVVWLFHGGSGSAEQWVSVILEGRLFANYLMADTFAVIVTECEERTKEKDIDGDGYFRWQYTGDTVANVDIANVRAIRDIFINRGWMTPETPIVSQGYSNGGFFGTMVAFLLHWKAALMHNSLGLPPVIENTSMPVLYSLSEFDDSPYMGPAGNAEAFNQYEYLIDKGNCAQYYLQPPTPAYPGRFKRIPGITAIKSLALFNELKNNGCLDADHYPVVKPDDITAMVIANPQNWPDYISLTNSQRSFFREQIAVMGALHYLNNDFCAKDLKFIKQACGETVSTPPPGKKDMTINIVPNPAQYLIILPENCNAVRIYTIDGKPVVEKTFLYENQLDVSGLPRGFYLIELYTDGQSQVVKMIKS